MKEYKNYSTEELLEINKENNDAILKSGKIYKKLETINDLLTGVAMVGILTLWISQDPILKITGLLAGFASTVVALKIINSKSYLTSKDDYHKSKEKKKLIQEELYFRGEENEKE